MLLRLDGVLHSRKFDCRTAKEVSEASLRRIKRLSSAPSKLESSLYLHVEPSTAPPKHRESRMTHRSVGERGEPCLQRTRELECRLGESQGYVTAKKQDTRSRESEAASCSNGRRRRSICQRARSARSSAPLCLSLPPLRLSSTSQRSPIFIIDYSSQPQLGCFTRSPKSDLLGNSATRRDQAAFALPSAALSSRLDLQRTSYSRSL